MTFWDWIMSLFRKPAPPPPVGPVPWGPTGSWRMVFEDTFNGSDLDTTKWSRDTWGGTVTVNGVFTSGDNVKVVDGELVLTLSSLNLGASINTSPADHHSTPGKVGFEAKVGTVSEARVYLPGDGERIYNWCAWWTSGQDWPKNGEHDIVETLGGWPEVNYHGPRSNKHLGSPAGYWGDAWHTYTLHRKTRSADVYWDGVRVASYSTEDVGGPHCMILSAGAGSFVKVGESMRVDYVRVWEPA